MTSKGFASLYRDVADRIAERETTVDREDIKIAGMLRKRASELDPLKPEEGSIVWWRYRPRYESIYYGPWKLGITCRANVGIYAADGLYHWDEIEWSPTHVAEEAPNND